MRRLISGLALAAAAMLGGGCSDDNTTKATVNAIRGEYLVTAVLVCGDCHTTPTPDGVPSFNPKDFLAGGRPFTELVAGVTQKVYSRNLTSDKDTGIGNWTDAQIKRAITRGIDNLGKPLFPAMPYWAFANLSDDDLSSIVMFLRTLPAHANLVSDDTIQIPAPATPIDPSLIPQSKLAKGDDNYDSAQHGRYLAGEAGACIACHTPTGATLDQPIDLSRAFAGGQLFPLGPITTISANLTPDDTGLKTWTATEIMSTVQSDLERGTGRMLCQPMPGGAFRAGDMTFGDLTDIANYLTTLAPVAHGPFGCTDGGVPYGLDGGS